MRAELGGDEINHALPVGIVFSPQTERGKGFDWRSAIPENPRTLLAAHGDGLMPLNGAQVFWNRGGHLFTLQ